MQPRTLPTILALLAVATLAACNDNGPASAAPAATTTKNDDGATLLVSQKARLTAADAPAADVAAVADANTAFALDLYGLLRAKDGNLLFSPYSVSLALAMTWSGAKTQTEVQMAQTMHWQLGQDALHPALGTLDLVLASRGQGKKAADGGVFRLRIANALWGQKDFGFLPGFLDLLALHYGAGMHVVDFAGAAETSRQTINAWVEKKTEGKIKDLLPQGSVTALTRLVLTNAIYFNAAWAKTFDEKLTQPGPFTRADGTQVQVPMMKSTGSMAYAKGTGWQAVALPYDGLELDMVVLVPDAGQLGAFEAAFDVKALAGMLTALAPQQVELHFPKFEFTAQAGLADVLKKLGMTLAFDPAAADLSGMDGKKDLFVSDVLHKAFIKVDEKGTEAAAATAVVVGTTSVPPPPLPLLVDRPFLFLIRDLQTKAVLFVGRVVDPTAK